MVTSYRTTTLNITVPESMCSLIQAQVARGGYRSIGDYFIDLVRGSADDGSQARLEALLLEGMDSGPARVMTPEDWARFKAEVVARNPGTKTSP